MTMPIKSLNMVTPPFCDPCASTGMRDRISKARLALDLGAADRLMAVVKRRPAKEAGPDAIREPLISSFAPLQDLLLCAKHLSSQAILPHEPIERVALRVW
jgi:hypothetical protein